MAYSKRTWGYGEGVAPDDMNRIENGIEYASNSADLFNLLSTKRTIHEKISVNDMVNIKDDFIALGVQKGVALAVLQTGATSDNSASVYIVYYNTANANSYITPIHEGGARSPRLTNTYELTLSTDATRRNVYVGLQLLFEY